MPISIQFTADFNDWLLACAVISSIASATNIALILDMGRWNGFLALILAMSLFQLLFDVSFYSNNVLSGESDDGHESAFIVTAIFQSFGGLGQTLVCNELIFIVLYLVIHKKSFDIFKNAIPLSAFVLVPILCAQLGYFIFLGTSIDLARVIAENFYFYERLLSAAAVGIAYICTSYLVWKLTRGVAVLTPQDMAIKTLISRLKYYPLLQAATYALFCWYELTYSFTFNPFAFNNPNRINTSDSPQISGLILVILLQLIKAVGYLFIFLNVQPNALKNLRSRLLTGKRFVTPQKADISMLISAHEQSLAHSSRPMDRSSVSRMQSIIDEYDEQDILSFLDDRSTHIRDSRGFDFNPSEVAEGSKSIDVMNPAYFMRFSEMSMISHSSESISISSSIPKVKTLDNYDAEDESDA